MRESPPVAIRREIDAAMLCSNSPCDSFITLGSFWPNSKSSYESRIIKAYKECCPSEKFEPHISTLCEFYAKQIMSAVHDTKFDWVMRVLSSGETKPESNRPQSLLENVIHKQTGAESITHLIFKSNSRPPMRWVEHLSGPEMLSNRIQYVAQDLFIKPAKLGGRVLLIDDIANTGASMRVYAHAIKAYAGVDTVHCVNLAATRFRRGKDGYGMLQLDVSALSNNPSLAQVWLDKSNVFHIQKDCPAIQSSPSCELRFLAERKAQPCPVCIEKEKSQKKWWQSVFYRNGR